MNSFKEPSAKLHYNFELTIWTSLGLILLEGHVNFFNILVDTLPFMEPLIPLFCTSDDISSDLQNQSGQPYSHLADATPDDLLMVSRLAWWLMAVPHMYVSSSEV